jgi:cold shock CspA family protein
MTGTVKSLDSASVFGIITTNEGQIFRFQTPSAPAFEVPSLAVGQVVTFDLGDGERPQALNVRLEPATQPSTLSEKRLTIDRLRYLGFQQEGYIRRYLFQLFAPGEPHKTFTVNSDLALFTKHGVRLQEGPGLCVRMLAGELNRLQASEEVTCGYSLTDREMLAHLADRPVPPPKGAKRDRSATGTAGSPVD